MAAYPLTASLSGGKITFLYLLSVFNVICGSQELFVHHSPDHVRFLREAGALSAKDVDKVITASYGFDSEEVLPWPGLAHTSAFKRPKATVLISVPGFTDSSLSKSHDSIPSYPLSKAENMIDTASVINNIQSGFMEHRPLIVDMNEQDMTQYPKVFRDLLNVDEGSEDGLSLMSSLGSLNASRTVDWAFISELDVVRRLVKAVEMEKTAIEDKIPDFFHFYVHGYQHIVDHYGGDSPQARDARNLLNKVITWITKTFRRLYRDNVVVLTVTLGSHPTPAEGSRQKRAAGDATQATASQPAPKHDSRDDQKKINTADSYSQDFPAIFNIILFSSLVLIISAFGISYCMWFMDPGRDSIIYRMTSQRMKKD